MFVFVRWLGAFGVGLCVRLYFMSGLYVVVLPPPSRGVVLLLFSLSLSLLVVFPM